MIETDEKLEAVSLIEERSFSLELMTSNEQSSSEIRFSSVGVDAWKLIGAIEKRWKAAQ